jgi:hypothetical protein
VSQQRQQLEARRQALRARSARLRGELAEDAGALGVRLRIADRLVAVARSDSGRLLLAAAAALVFFGRPRRIVRLALKGLALWPLVGPLLPHVRRVFSERSRDAGDASAAG